MNTVNSLTGRFVTLNLVSGRCVYGSVAEIIAQGVLIIHGVRDEQATFYPWHIVADMGYTYPIYPDQCPQPIISGEVSASIVTEGNKVARVGDFGEIDGC